MPNNQEQKPVLALSDRKECIIQIGDIVEIRCRGFVRSGEVVTCWYDDVRDNHYIELESTQAGFVYWKEGQDGGSIRLVKSFTPRNENIVLQQWGLVLGSTGYNNEMSSWEYNWIKAKTTPNTAIKEG